MVGWHHRLNGREFEPCQETVPGRGAWGLPSRGHRADAAEWQQLTCSAVWGVQRSDAVIHVFMVSALFSPSSPCGSLQNPERSPPTAQQTLLVIHGSVHMFPRLLMDCSLPLSPHSLRVWSCSVNTFFCIIVQIRLWSETLWRFSSSDSCYSLWPSVGPSLFLQMALFHFLKWLNSIPL